MMTLTWTYLLSCQWPVPPAVFLLYRFFFATLFVIIIVLSGTLDHDWYTSDSNKVKWFVYFTNWGLLTLTLTVLVQFFLVGYASYRGSSRSTYGGTHALSKLKKRPAI